MSFRFTRLRHAFALAAAAGAMLPPLFATPARADDNPWVVYEGKPGLPGSGKHVVLVSGDEEYRSEEALPQLGKILSQHHGFKCTVLFAIDPDTGIIDSNIQTNIPGLAALDNADMMVIATRFRHLPDSDTKHIADFVEAGKPILGLRTATHAFNYPGKSNSAYKKWSFNSRVPGWEGGFGRQILGDTWISHHGHHKSESTRGIIDEQHKSHPILRGVDDLWGPTDVYGIRNLGDDATILVHGQVLKGMSPGDAPVDGEKNNPMMPVSWTREYKAESGKTCRVVCSTFFSSMEMQCEDIRRFLVNSVFWGTGMQDQIKPDLDVSIVGEFKPTMFGFHKGDYWKKKGMKPADFALEKPE